MNSKQLRNIIGTVIGVKMWLEGQSIKADEKAQELEDIAYILEEELIKVKKYER